VNEPRAALPHRPSDSTLAELPARVLTFLNAIALRDPIWTLMQAGGFRTEDHAEGWALLTAACRCRQRGTFGRAQLRAQSAMSEIHQWVTTHFGRFRAALERLHPEATVLFPETDTRYPTDSLLAMAGLLDRLRQGDERLDRAQQDAALLATLAQRGLDGAEIERLARLVTDAQSVEGTAGDEPDVDARERDLVALYHWYRDWAETAKRLVTRRDYRGSLGISGKRETAE
jgi:hypothetical protein